MIQIPDAIAAHGNAIMSVFVMRAFGPLGLLKDRFAFNYLTAARAAAAATDGSTDAMMWAFACAAMEGDHVEAATDSAVVYGMVAENTITLVQSLLSLDRAAPLC